LFGRSPYTLPSLAKRGIRDDWTTQKETVIKDIKEELLGTEVKLMADVDLIWKMFVDAKKVGVSRLTCFLIMINQTHLLNDRPNKTVISISN
jgi:hypothetical protein